jgi:hypothetical protein
MASPRIPLSALLPVAATAGAFACTSPAQPTGGPATTPAPAAAPAPVADAGPVPSVYLRPRAEVKETGIALEMPAVPAFDPPKSSGDSRSPRELRLTGRKLLGAKVQVRGFVVWKYDCATAGTGPQGAFGQGKSLAARKKMVAQKPWLCWRPHLYLGDEANTPREKTIWVVEVPRPLRKDEMHEVGDEVIITGTWDLQSPKGFANSDGLLVYESMRNLTKP